MIGSSFYLIGCGLIYTLDINSSTGQYVGFQIVAGVGIGLAVQVPVIVAQALSAQADISSTVATILCRSLYHST